MTEPSLLEESLFLRALELGSAEKQAAFLDRECTASAELRRSVEALLRHHREGSGFLESPPTEVLAAGEQLTAREAETPGLDFLAPSAEPASIGRLGHYEILEVLGRGGFGVVLKASDPKLNRIVAIKVLAPELASNPTARKRFEREAHAAAAVVHQHIVTIHAVDEDRLPYLVMECIDGQSLKEKIDREGQLQLIEIVRIGQQVAAGLAAAHAHGLMHRDVKPANILLENGVERVRITDFGLARAVDDVGMTRTGEVAGTPQYMSPEQAQGLPMDVRSDLFSVGCVLYAMCTGRPPFRADSTPAVLHRVCHDTPRPIQEINREIPDWLIAIVDRLLEKQPADRFQSAEEIAELLGQHLAHLQHPSVFPLPAANDCAAVSRVADARTSRSAGKAIPARRWLVAAAALVVLIGSLSVSEGLGVTSVAQTVIRIFTADGTLVVQTSDPSVRVTVEGDGGLRKTGAGLEEIRLRPGNYKVHADKGGTSVPLEREVVSIARGGREVVNVKLETLPPPQGAFVLIADGKEREFSTLADAVLTASDGDAIEIRGHGPFVTSPISIVGKALTIRAGRGFRPVIRIASDKPIKDLIATTARLVLEGLEIRDVTKDSRRSDLYTMIRTGGSSLHLCNCRLLQEEPQNTYLQLVVGNSNISLQNCELYSPTPSLVGAGNQSPLRIEMNNCVGLGGAATYVHHGHATNPITVEYRRNTLVTAMVATVGFSVAPDPPAPAEANKVKRLRFDATCNVFDNGATTLLVQPLDPFRASTKWEKGEDAQQVFAPVVAWREQSNLYAPATLSISWQSAAGDHRAPSGGSLKEWEKFWGLADTGSGEGQIRLRGGDLRAKMQTQGPASITPEDFRLREGSPGHGAGPDGKDLGADVGLVGPGPAYERWQQTPEYLQWLMDSGQPWRAATAEPGAFVLLFGGKERKFNTLAGAVSAANNGDTIEIRGNGPFVSDPVNCGQTALTIRAGAGFRPIIKMRPEFTEGTVYLLRTNAALVLEGLEFQRARSKNEEKGSRFAVNCADAPLWAANCRFNVAVFSPRAPRCVFRNCDFLGTGGWAGGVRQSGSTFVVENCLHRNSGSMQIGFNFLGGLPRDASIRIRRSTFASSNMSLAWTQKSPLSELPKLSDDSVSMAIDVADSIFDVQGVLGVEQGGDQVATLEPAEAEGALLRLVRWRGERNLYAGTRPLLAWTAGWKLLPPHGPQTLDEWKRFWNTSESGSLEGRVQFQGGNLASRPDIDRLTPEDFRLRKDSPGYGALPDDKDLGADMDLVGPGPAYEHWKTTPEYQEWLEETGQKKSEESGVKDQGSARNTPTQADP